MSQRVMARASWKDENVPALDRPPLLIGPISELDLFCRVSCRMRKSGGFSSRSYLVVLIPVKFRL
jgi:hypothetical protein